MKLFPSTPQHAGRQRSRRDFLQTCPIAVGAVWLGATPGGGAAAAAGRSVDFGSPRAPQRPAGQGTVKRVIFLHMVGGPSQLELFDYKPALRRRDGQVGPADLRGDRWSAGRRGRARLLGPQCRFAQHGQSGAWISERLPHFARVADSVAFVRSMQTPTVDHTAAQLHLHTGHAQPGHPSLGAWLTQAHRSDLADSLPGQVVLFSGRGLPGAGAALWGNGYLPAEHQGIRCRASGDPVLLLSDPEGVKPPVRSAMVGTIGELHRQRQRAQGPRAGLPPVAQYEAAFRMQSAAAEATDLGQETAEVLRLYGAQPGRESFANNCLLARRLVERGVRYVQLFDEGWDAHGATACESLDRSFQTKCAQIDRPIAGLLTDLRRSGLLEDTLVVWSGEFGRSPWRERGVSRVGRADHGEAFTTWLAGGGIRAGVQYGQTDELGYRAVENPVQLADLHATMRHLMALKPDPRQLPSGVPIAGIFR